MLRCLLSMAGIVLAVGATTFGDGPATAPALPQAGTQPANQEPGPATRPQNEVLWISICPKMPAIGSLNELVIPYTARHGDGKVRVEIRTADQKRRVASIMQELPAMGKIPPSRFSSASTWSFKYQRPALPATDEGAYVMACVKDGVRCSNVATFRVAKDVAAAYKNEPLLDLTLTDAGPGQDLPEVILRATRHVDADPAPFARDVAYPTLTVDGIERKPTAIMWMGSNAALHVGGSHVYLIDLKFYVPAIDLKGPGPHVIFAKVGNTISQTIPLSADLPLEQAWDAATPKLP